MTAPFSTYTPSLSVALFKTIQRTDFALGIPVSERFTGSSLGNAGTRIDLTPYLGERGGVRTSKAVNEPAGGFTVTLSDQRFDPTMDSIYSAIEPMDLIEIRMSHEPLAGGPIPVVMRGFVSRVSRDEAMSDDGRPARTVTISGQDYGKIWQTMQVLPLANAILEPGKTLFYLRVLDKYGIEVVDTLKIEDFATSMINGALNPLLATLVPSGVASSLPAGVQTDGVFVTGQRINVPALSNFTSGNLYDLMRQFCDVGIWNEMFLEDHDAGVSLVLRPRPMIDVVTGQFIQPVAGFATVLPDQTPGYPATGSSATAATPSGASLAGQADYEAALDAIGALRDQAASLLNASQNQTATVAAQMQTQAAALQAQADAALVSANAALQADIASNVAAAAAAAGAQPLPASVLDIPMADVKAISVTRSDENVANFYWVHCTPYDWNQGALVSNLQLTDEYASIDFRAYGNSSNTLYGDRQMTAEVATWPVDALNGDSGQPATTIQDDQSFYQSWLRDRRSVLANQNKDNVIFESGTLRMRGRSDVRAGTYLRITRAGVRFIVYAVRVDHEFIPFVGFTTTVQFDRGTGFAERIKANTPVYDAEKF